MTDADVEQARKLADKAHTFLIGANGWLSIADARLNDSKPLDDAAASVLARMMQYVANDAYELSLTCDRLRRVLDERQQ